MKIRPDICWKLENGITESIDPRIFTLLQNIRTKGSLKLAAEEANLSYRHAWGMLRELGERLQSPVARMKKGLGASLTEVGENILAADHLTRTRLSQELQDIIKDVNNQFTKILIDKQRGKLRINASHGLAIAHLHTLLQESQNLNVDFHFRGSLESLRELANTRCDIAGFHFPAGPIGKHLAPCYLQWLNQEEHFLVKFVIRQQGLMVKRGNPHKIKRLRDLTRRSVKFINRQEESGTRTILDELLRIEGINTDRIKGYRTEEFTHLAVGALIASSTADAGFGIEAAARKFGLHFIPVISETYVFAIDRGIPQQLADKFIKLVKSRKIRSLVNTLPGYDAKHAGKLLSFNELFNQ